MSGQGIDLAPNHKIGLIVENPVLLSPVAAGFGDRLPRDLGRPGAIVVGPLSAAGGGYGRAGLAEVEGGVLALPAGFSRSARRAVDRYGSAWERCGCPVVVQLVDTTPADFAKAAQRAAGAPAVAGIEWSLPGDLKAAALAEGLRAAQRVMDLPVWVKLPWGRVQELAEGASAAGAVALVVAQPPAGSTLRSASSGAGDLMAGALHGPLLLPLVLQEVAAVAQMRLPCALIASGGVFTPAQMAQALAAGASAVQLDAVLWSEPGIVRPMVEQWQAAAAARDGRPPAPG